MRERFVLNDVLHGGVNGIGKRYVYVREQKSNEHGFVNHVMIELTPAEFDRRGHSGELWVDLDPVL